MSDAPDTPVTSRAPFFATVRPHAAAIRAAGVADHDQREREGGDHRRRSRAVDGLEGVRSGPHNVANSARLGCMDFGRIIPVESFPGSSKLFRRGAPSYVGEQKGSLLQFRLFVENHLSIRLARLLSGKLLTERH